MAFELDDRTLAHVEIIVLAKLRRNESFACSIDTGNGGRSTVWLNPASTVQFVFENAAQEISREWLDALMDTANAPSGLRIVDDPTS